MTLGEAIQTAIDYETRIRDIYNEAAGRVSDPVGMRLFKALASDEQYHIDYLNKKLGQWQNSGQLTVEDLKSSVPAFDNISKGVGKLEKRMAEEDRGDEKQMLSKALTVEVETSNFYKKMVDEMPEPCSQDFLSLKTDISLRFRRSWIISTAAVTGLTGKSLIWNEAPRSKMRAIKAELRRSLTRLRSLSFGAVHLAIHCFSKLQEVLAKANNLCAIRQLQPIPLGCVFESPGTLWFQSYPKLP